MRTMRYTRPTITDYGSLTDLTRMQAVTGSSEDSAMKAIPFHHNPAVSAPQNP